MTEALVNAITHGSVPASSVGVVFPVDSEHGRGLVMIDAIANRVEIEPCDGGIRITLEFTRATLTTLYPYTRQSAVSMPSASAPHSSAAGLSGPQCIDPNLSATTS
jgi:hypothetical protein